MLILNEKNHVRAGERCMHSQLGVGILCSGWVSHVRAGCRLQSDMVGYLDYGVLFSLGEDARPTRTPKDRM